MYNFVDDAEDPDMQGQMAAFDTIMKDVKNELDGTIIRIPLRTKEQAMISEITERVTTVAEVRDVLEKFAIEFGNNGLLFMRNVEQLIISSTSGVSAEINLTNKETVRE